MAGGSGSAGYTGRAGRRSRRRSCRDAMRGSRGARRLRFARSNGRRDRNVVGVPSDVRHRIPAPHPRGTTRLHENWGRILPRVPTLRNRGRRSERGGGHRARRRTQPGSRNRVPEEVNAGDHAHQTLTGGNTRVPRVRQTEESNTPRWIRWEISHRVDHIRIPDPHMSYDRVSFMGYPVHNPFCRGIDWESRND